jgi:radical SAM protein with 4Fe4S-binding SPASM domain
VNHTVKEIAELLAKKGSAREASMCLQSKYGISEEVARKDVEFVREKLTRNGFSIHENAPATHRLPRPDEVFFQLTSRCNLSCVHCYVSDPAQVNKLNLPVSPVLNIIDELVNLHGSSIVLSGGEPLLHPDLKKIIRHAAPRVKIKLLTNGTLINQEWAEFLSDMGVKVQISVDGSSDVIHDQIRGKGSFSKAIRGLKHLQSAGSGDKINFSTTVMNQNIEDLPEIIHLAKSLEVPLVRFLPLRKKGSACTTWEMIGAGLTSSKQERFYDYVRRLCTQNQAPFEISCGLSGFLLNMPEEFQEDDIWCPLGKQIIIAPNGDAYPCPLLMDRQFWMGNVFHDSLEKIVQSDGMSEVCRALVERRQKIETCGACTWRNFCQAGCMGQALDNKGTIWDTDNFCQYRKRLYEEAFDRILALEDEKAA